MKEPSFHFSLFIPRNQTIKWSEFFCRYQLSSWQFAHGNCAAHGVQSLCSMTSIHIGFQPRPSEKMNTLLLLEVLWYDEQTECRTFPMIGKTKDRCLQVCKPYCVKGIYWFSAADCLHPDLSHCSLLLLWAWTPPQPIAPLGPLCSPPLCTHVLNIPSCPASSCQHFTVLIIQETSTYT